MGFIHRQKHKTNSQTNDVEVHHMNLAAGLEKTYYFCMWFFALECVWKVLLSVETRTEELSAGVVTPTPSEGQGEVGKRVSAGLWPDGKEGSEWGAAREPHQQALSPPEVCDCVRHWGGGGWGGGGGGGGGGGVPGCGQGEMAKLTVHLFEKCEQENFQSNSEQILSPEKKNSAFTRRLSLQSHYPSHVFLYDLWEETMSRILLDVKKNVFALNNTNITFEK